VTESRFEMGMKVRKEVLGSEYVERAQARTTEFDADFQRFITESAWGSVWARPDLDRRTRSLVTIAILAALGREELALHLRASRNIGVDPHEIAEVLLEIWQANAAGRYLHKRDEWPGQLDPNFLGIGRCLTNEEGVYRFLTIRPGAYPWKNRPNAWRPAHIHFSLFGSSLLSRLVTQMYFPDDPLRQLDPIINALPTEAARARLVAAYDHNVTEPEWALGYRWDIVVRGPYATPAEPTNAGDPVLQYVPDDRRATLLARRELAYAALVYRFDIVLQGAGETAFFNL
jgi:protocatechuate 3,4-dioxygenase beta subunit